MGSKPAQFKDVLEAELKGIRENRPDKNAPLAALCLSGGGIRSATFCLGVIQGLARKGLLPQFDYLSTVSGGGYIGAWLTAWIYREDSKVERVAASLASSDPPPGDNAVHPIGHLRKYNSYLTPSVGLFSVDTWTVFATVFRNIFLNWLVLVPLILCVLMLPRILCSVFAFADYTYPGARPWYWPWILKGILVAGIAMGGAAVFNVLLFLPAVGNVRHKPGDFVRVIFVPLVVSAFLVNVSFSWSHYLPEPWECLLAGFSIALSGWVLFMIRAVWRKHWNTVRPRVLPITGALALAGMFIAGALWVMYHMIFNLDNIGYPEITGIAPPLLIGGFLVGAALFIGLASSALSDDDREWLSRAGAFLILFNVYWAISCSLVLEGPEFVFSWPSWGPSAVAAFGAVSGAISTFAGFSSKSKYKDDQPDKTPLQYRIALALAPPVFIVLFLVGLAMATNWLIAHVGLSPSSWTEHDHLLKTTSIWADCLLAGAFASIGVVMSLFININWFSLHAMYRARLVRAYLGASNFDRRVNPFTDFDSSDNVKMHEVPPSQRPYHVVNLTLNLTSGKNLAWQQRKGEPFTVSPAFCGNPRLGYRPSEEYANGISLGTAMTISGAAASPNMGYQSSPVVAFIMTLFNARLGAWLGNPGARHKATWRHDGPKTAVLSLINEALGRSEDESSYVYLSDGGHFENLGIYEMVRRRCHYIVSVDSGCDPECTYEDLGNALRKIRIDMGIPIEFEGLAQPLWEKKKRCAIARIRYSCVDKTPMDDDGYLIYIKPLSIRSEPPDVCSYHAANRTFPHESTANQWFNESQTESYRMLGSHTVDEMCGRWAGGDLESLRWRLETGYLISDGAADEV